MELRIHRLTGICLPSAPNPTEWASLIGAALHRASTHITDAICSHACAVRLALYAAVGTATGTLAAAGGMDTSDAISLGMNVAATAASFWPPACVRQSVIGSEVG